MHDVCQEDNHSVPVPRVVNAQHSYSPMRPTCNGYALKRALSTEFVLATGQKNTSLKRVAIVTRGSGGFVRREPSRFRKSAPKQALNHSQKRSRQFFIPGLALSEILTREKDRFYRTMTTFLLHVYDEQMYM